MSAIPSFAFHDMDASQLHDRMDVASSPFQQADDLDVDLESFRDPSVLEDEMIDYQADITDQNDGLMQDVPDDEMIDEASTAGHEFDYNMESFVGQPRDEDEDILYEDDEEPEVIAQRSNDDDAEHQPLVDQKAGSIGGAADDHNNYDGLDAPITLQNDDKSVSEDPNPNKPPDNIDSVTPLDHPQDPTHSNLPQFDAQSSSGHLEQTFQNQEEIEEVDEEAPEDLLPVQSEVAHVDSLEHHQEDDFTVEDGQHGPPLPQDTAHISPYEHSEDVQKSNEIHNEPARDVHPVTLVYLEEEMSLFPPMLGDDSTVYFLSDPSLAFQSLDKLLAACREILTGTLDHHDELVLDIPGLGLHICEDSKYSAQITLANVLEVYLSLCHNDVDDPSQPLYCHLSSRVSLASQYAYLSSAGAEGKTYTEIVADHIDTPAEESTPVDDPLYVHEVQEDIARATEHEGEHNTEKDSKGLPPAPDTESQGLPSEDTFNPQQIVVEPNEGLEEPLEAGAQNPKEEISTETVSTTAQDLEPDQAQERDTDFSTLGDGDQDRDGDQGQHEQGHEAETNSSHTLEAYQDDIEDQEAYGEDVEGEDLFNAGNEDVEDLLNQQENADFEEHDIGEELFTKDDAGQEDDGLSGSLISEAADDQSLAASVEQTPFDNDVGAASPDYLDDEAEPGIPNIPEEQVSVVPSLPITPSKATVAKRKAEADDELDFLDISTPEPKRRRPS